MAVDRRPILTTLADKYAMRSHVAERVGPQYLPSLYAVVDDPCFIPWDELPPRFVIKATHGSGATVIVDDRAALDATIPEPAGKHPWGVLVRVHPSRLNRKALETLTRAWLASNYWRIFGINEWAYRNIPPKLIIEELLDDNGLSPADYRFWCFNGAVGFIMVDAPRLHDSWRSLHDIDWSIIQARIRYGAPKTPPPCPAKLTEMLSIATALAAGLDFVRVDLYVVGDRIVVGELTHYPAGGTQQMWPEDVLSAFGQQWCPGSLD